MREYQSSELILCKKVNKQIMQNVNLLLKASLIDVQYPKIRELYSLDIKKRKIYNGEEEKQEEEEQRGYLS